MIKITTVASPMSEVYTVNMSIMTKIIDTSVPKTKNIVPVAYIYSTILVICAVTQMLSFTDFQELIDSFWLPGGAPLAYFLAGFIIIAEIFALPFLLRIRASPFVRYSSMVLSWIVPLFWLTISLWLMLTINAVSNVGLVGTVVKLMPGWWAVFFSIALGILAIWASWGLSTGPKNRKK